jgi:hypothetical protein
MLARRTSKNQITLPERVADQFAGTDTFEVTAEEGKIILRPVGAVDRSSRADLYARAADLVGSFRDGDGAGDLSVRHDEHLDQAYK